MTNYLLDGQGGRLTGSSPTDFLLADGSVENNGDVTEAALAASVASAVCVLVASRAEAAQAVDLCTGAREPRDIVDAITVRAADLVEAASADTFIDAVVDRAPGEVEAAEAIDVSDAGLVFIAEIAEAAEATDEAQAGLVIEAAIIERATALKAKIVEACNGTDRSQRHVRHHHQDEHHVFVWRQHGLARRRRAVPSEARAQSRRWC
jgi:hypothetical protein